MSSKKKRKSPCSFASSKKPSKSKAFEIIRYIVRAGRKLKTKAKTNLQTRTHKSHGRTIVAGNRLQENLVKSISCQFCHANVTVLENVSASSGLVVQLLSTKIVQISDTSMKLSQITKVPKGNIF